jgi:hypothetical protein
VQVNKILLTQSNDEVAAKDVEIRLTVNGVAFTNTLSCDSGTAYYVHWIADATGITMDTVDGLFLFVPIPAPGDQASSLPQILHDFKLEARITSAAGTNQTLTTVYEVWDLLP